MSATTKIRINVFQTAIAVADITRSVNAGEHPKKFLIQSRLRQSPLLTLRVAVESISHNLEQRLDRSHSN